jgi:hypothetical protein
MTGNGLSGLPPGNGVARKRIDCGKRCEGAEEASTDHLQNGN